MNGASILAIPLSEPERLFISPIELKSEYHTLMKHWHPDNCLEPVTTEEATLIAAHITALYQSAVDIVKRGIWHARRGGEMFLTSKEGRTHLVKYRARRAFEIGEVLISRHVITYLIPREHEALVIAGLRTIGSIKYPAPAFQTMESQVPRVIRNFETPDMYVIAVQKDINDIAVADLLEYMGGRIDPRHAAWIVSGMLNLLSFLSMSRLTVNGLTPATVWANPIRHRVSFLGGWWYGAERGKPITHLPPFAHSYAGRDLLREKRATPILDIECARAIGRFALGDVSGGSFRLRSDIPDAIAQFLRSPSRADAIAEYESWYNSLHDSYGPRQFHKCDITGDQVYPETRKD